MWQDVTFITGEAATQLTPVTAPFISGVRIHIKSTKTDQRGVGFARTMRSQPRAPCAGATIQTFAW